MIEYKKILTESIDSIDLERVTIYRSYNSIFDKNGTVQKIPNGRIKISIEGVDAEMRTENLKTLEKIFQDGGFGIEKNLWG